MCDEALKCVTFRLSTTVSCSVLIMFCKQYYFVVFKKVKLKPRLNLSRSSYHFSVCDFLYDF